MKYASIKILGVAFLFLVLNLGHLGMAHADSSETMRVVESSGMEDNATHVPMCGEGLVCFIHCLEINTDTMSAVKGGSFEKRWGVCDLENERAGESLVFSDTSQTSFSPPDDPDRMLTLLKRE